MTTDLAEIEKFLLSSGQKVIFCTYQSSPQIAKVQENSAIPAFDVVFADEAHRCAGKVSNDFACVLDEAKIRAKKRLFMTATPRVFSTAVKVAAEGRGVDMACMEDERIFGRVLHRLNFSEAIERELLTDYKVLIVGVDDPMMKAWIENREFLQTETGLEADAQTLAAYIGLLKVMRDYDLKRVISFHGRVQRADDFATGFKQVFDWVATEHKPAGTVIADYVSGKMNTGERSRKIKRLKNLHAQERALLANARCLAEGVDVPALDGVAFIDPRKSQVDIVQAVGRAIRNSENKAHGLVLIPVFIGESDSPEAELEKSCYQPIWAVLNALRSHDDVLAQELDNFRTSLGRGKGGDSGFGKIVVDLPRKVGDEFVSALNARLVEMTTASWHFWYGLLEEYVKEHGHARVPAEFEYQSFKLGSWVSEQRKINTKNKLSLERIQKLELLSQWSWNPLDDQWNEGFNYLKQYVEEHSHAKAPNRLKYKSFNLGTWINSQRQIRNKLDLKKIQLLEELPQWSWNPLEDQWNEGFKYLKIYIEQYDSTKVPRNFKYHNFNLGLWVQSQRSRKNKLSLERLQLLDSLPQWSWNIFEEQWNEGFEYLKKYVEEYGHTKVPHRFKYESFNLGKWVSHRRNEKNELTSDRIKVLESFPNWSWNPLEDQWNDGFEYLKKYVKEYGHSKVPKKFKYHNFNLGGWVSSQRTNNRKKKLDLEKIKKLESLPGWVWRVKKENNE